MLEKELQQFADKLKAKTEKKKKHLLIFKGFMKRILPAGQSITEWRAHGWKTEKEVKDTSDKRDRMRYRKLIA